MRKERARLEAVDRGDRRDRRSGREAFEFRVGKNGRGGWGGLGKLRGQSRERNDVFKRNLRFDVFRVVALTEPPLDLPEPGRFQPSDLFEEERVAQSAVVLGQNGEGGERRGRFAGFVDFGDFAGVVGIVDFDGRDGRGRCVAEREVERGGAERGVVRNVRKPLRKRVGKSRRFRDERRFFVRPKDAPSFAVVGRGDFEPGRNAVGIAVFAVAGEDDAVELDRLRPSKDERRGRVARFCDPTRAVSETTVD